MGFHNAAVARPQVRYVTETIALTAALLLGRRHIYADYFTRWRLALILVILGVQLWIVLGAAAAEIHCLRKSTLTATTQTVLNAVYATWTVGGWALVSTTVLWHYARARREARLVATKPAHDGVYVYDLRIDPSEPYERHLDEHLRLGKSRRWEDPLIFRYAPRLHRSKVPGTEWSSYADWIWTTQTFFEPQLLMSIAFYCFITFNPNFIYFLAACACLGASGDATKHWFEWEGHRRFWEAEEKRQAEEQKRRDAEERAAEEARRNFTVCGEPPPAALRSTSAEDAYERLSPELRRLLKR